jgi:hypothetical protein
MLDNDKTPTELSRATAENERQEAETTRVRGEHDREHAESARQEQEALRQVAEETRQAAEETRDEAIASVAATADALSANLAQMQFLQDAWKTLRHLTPPKPGDVH